MTGRTCPCGKEFIPKRRNQIHCHRECNNPLNHNCSYSEVQRNSKYKAQYGISLEDYNHMFEAQGGCCKLCAKHQTEIKGRLHVDHRHSDRKVRGLLCGKCNQALGLLNEDLSTIKAMEEYLKW